MTSNPKVQNTRKHKHKKRLSKKELKDRFAFFNFLLKLKPEERCQIIRYLSIDHIDYICEALYNTVYVDNNLDKAQINKLKKELGSCKSHIKSICDHKLNPDKKRKILEQKGGFLGALLTTVLPIVSSLISPLFKKK